MDVSRRVQIRSNKVPLLHEIIGTDRACNPDTILAFYLFFRFCGSSFSEERTNMGAHRRAQNNWKRKVRQLHK